MFDPSPYVIVVGADGRSFTIKGPRQYVESGIVNYGIAMDRAARLKRHYLYQRAAIAADASHVEVDPGERDTNWEKHEETDPAMRRDLDHKRDEEWQGNSPGVEGVSENEGVELGERVYDAAPSLGMFAPGSLDGGEGSGIKGHTTPKEQGSGRQGGGEQASPGKRFLPQGYQHPKELQNWFYNNPDDARESDVEDMVSAFGVSQEQAQNFFDAIHGNIEQRLPTPMGKGPKNMTKAGSVRPPPPAPRSRTPDSATGWSPGAGSLDGGEGSGIKGHTTPKEQGAGRSRNRNWATPIKSPNETGPRTDKQMATQKIKAFAKKGLNSEQAAARLTPGEQRALVQQFGSVHQALREHGGASPASQYSGQGYTTPGNMRSDPHFAEQQQRWGQQLRENPGILRPPPDSATGWSSGAGMDSEENGPTNKIKQTNEANFSEVQPNKSKPVSVPSNPQKSEVGKDTRRPFARDVEPGHQAFRQANNPAPPKSSGGMIKPAPDPKVEMAKANQEHKHAMEQGQQEHANATALSKQEHEQELERDKAAAAQSNIIDQQKMKIQQQAAQQKLGMQQQQHEQKMGMQAQQNQQKMGQAQQQFNQQAQRDNQQAQRDQQAHQLKLQRDQQAARTNMYSQGQNYPGERRVEFGREQGRQENQDQNDPMMGRTRVMPTGAPDEQMGMDPLTSKGNKIMSAMQNQYGSKKGKEVFYASKNKGNPGMTNVDRMRGFLKDKGFGANDLKQACDLAMGGMTGVGARSSRRR